MGHKPERNPRAAKHRALADELRENSAAAPERKRREEAARREQWAERLYQECRAGAKKASDDGKREACVGTGFTPGNVGDDDQRMLEDVIERIRTEDKLRVRLGTTTTRHTSDDTGENFTRDHVVFLITW